MEARAPTSRDLPATTAIIPSIRHKLQTLRELLVRPVDAAAVATFRILFGGLMVWEVYRYFALDRITDYYVNSQFFFTYELFPNLYPWPEPWIHAHFLAMGLFAAGIMLGLFYRISAFFFFITYTYVFLLDKAQYNNHYYLIILISFLLTLIDAHRWASLDGWWRGWAGNVYEQWVPYWNVFILRAQIFIVYIFAGIAKLNPDWLRGEPLRQWLANRADYPFLGQFFTTEPAVFLFGYGGLLFDLSIGFLLVWRRTRWLALLGVLFFNLMNKWLFSIGVFPYLMIATTVLFWGPSWPRRLLRRAVFNTPKVWAGHQAGRQSWVAGFVVVYLTIQILLPLRHWLYPGEVSWTEEGHRFSWHMKLRDKDAVIIFYVTDPKTNQTWEVDIADRLTARQYNKMSIRPDMILQFAHHIKQEFHRAGVIENPIVTVEAWASLNGRPFQQFVDPDIDLGQQFYSPFKHATWIIPLQDNVVPEPLSNNGPQR